jgi:hypothetical protein
MIFEAGRGPHKGSRGKLLSDRAMKTAIEFEIAAAVAMRSLVFGISAGTVTAALNQAENPIPRFDPRSNRISALRIVVGDRSFRTDLLVDIEQASIRNLEIDYDAMRLKFAGGIAVKAVTALAAAYTAKLATEYGSGAINSVGGCQGFFVGALELFRWLGKMADGCLSVFGVGRGSRMAGVAAGTGTAAALFSGMRPDLRSWRTLPANIQIGRMSLAPGEYEITVEFLARDGAIDRTAMEKVTIRKGAPTYLNYRTLY